MAHNIRSAENPARLKSHLVNALAQESERRPPARDNLQVEAQQRLEMFFARTGLRPIFTPRLEAAGAARDARRAGRSPGAGRREC